MGVDIKQISNYEKYFTSFSSISPTKEKYWQELNSNGLIKYPFFWEKNQSDEWVSSPLYGEIVFANVDSFWIPNENLVCAIETLRYRAFPINSNIDRIALGSSTFFLPYIERFNTGIGSISISYTIQTNQDLYLQFRDTGNNQSTAFASVNIKYRYKRA